MIKFFRKIRYNFMEQNKTGRYFKYAIGEIILVVIGILIALQINNWNEAKKIKKKERQVLTEITSDLEHSITDIDRVVNTRTFNLKKTISSLQTLIKVLKSNHPYHDSLSDHFSAINAYSKVNFKTSGYESLVSIGTDLIERPEIRSSIGTFYASTTKQVQNNYEEIHLDFYSYMIDYYRKDFNTVLVGDSLETLVPVDFEALKQNDEYLQSLHTFLSVNIPYRDVLNNAKDEAFQLKENIDEYLNHN